LQKNIIDKTCPNLSDIDVAREFLLDLDAQRDFIKPGYSWRLRKVVGWMQVNSWCLVQKKLSLKAKQQDPDFPSELIEQYQVITNVLNHYLRSSRSRPAAPKPDDYFRQNIQKVPGFSIIDSWTNTKEFLKQWT